MTRARRPQLDTLTAWDAWPVLNREGIPVARCTVERLMRQLGVGGVGFTEQGSPRTL